MTRFRFGTLALFSASVLLATAVRPTEVSAQDYPTRAITWVVPFAAGGGASQLPQFLRAPLEKELGQTVVIDNQPGAGTMKGTAAVANTEADGYTLLYASSATSMAPSVMVNIPVDVLGELTPVGMIGTSPFVLLVNKDAGIDSVMALVEKARAAPGKLSFGSAGVGSAHHMFMGYLMAQTGVRLRHIPFQGGNPAATAVASNEVTVAFADAGAVREMVNGGLVNALAVTTAERSTVLPDVPTMQEAGLAEFDLSVWSGVMGPKAMDDNVVSRVNEALGKVLADPEVREGLARLGIAAGAYTVSDFARFVTDDVNRWKQVVADVGIEKR